jgi:hypothetical protein
MYLLHLLHEIVFRVQTTGGVADEELGAGLDGTLITFETNSGGITIRRAFDERYVEALRPDFKLLHSSSAEGVRSGQHELVPGFLKQISKLRCGGGFAHAIDADDEEHLGSAILKRHKRAGGFRENLPHMIASYLDDVRTVQLPLLGLEIGDDLERELRAEVTGDEGGFEVIPIDVGLGETLEE